MVIYLVMGGGTDMVDLDEATQLELAQWLATHKLEPSRGQGSVRLEFQEHPFTQAPALEPLLHCAAGRAWFVRWPNGSLRWVTEAFLVERGFAVPITPLVAEV